MEWKTDLEETERDECDGESGWDWDRCYEGEKYFLKLVSSELCECETVDAK